MKPGVESLWQRRLRIFRAQRRGRLSFAILAGALLVSLFAELLCNQRPLLARYDGVLYWPVLKIYSESTFGGIFETEADYSDPSVAAEFEKPGNWAIYAPIRFDYKHVDTQLTSPAPSPPYARHLLGTDDRARDVAARLLYGFRLSLVFGLALALFSSIFGIVIGAIQGYAGGLIDLIGQRVTEVWSSQNELYVLIILSALFEPSIQVIFGLLSVFGWMGLASYVRAEFLRARQYEFVHAAIAMGGTPLRVMLKHVLPNTLTPVITFFPFRVSAGIMGLTALDFLGLGVPPPTPSLGELLAQGKSNLSSWWIITSVFVVITLSIMLLNFLGEAIQKALDPRTS